MYTKGLFSLQSCWRSILNVACRKQFYFIQDLLLLQKDSPRHFLIVWFWFGLAGRLTSYGYRAMLVSSLGVIERQSLKITESKVKTNIVQSSYLLDKTNCYKLWHHCISLFCLPFYNFSSDAALHFKQHWSVESTTLQVSKAGKVSKQAKQTSQISQKQRNVNRFSFK